MDNSRMWSQAAHSKLYKVSIIAHCLPDETPDSDDSLINCFFFDKTSFPATRSYTARLAVFESQATSRTREAAFNLLIQFYQFEIRIGIWTIALRKVRTERLEPALSAFECDSTKLARLLVVRFSPEACFALPNRQNRWCTSDKNASKKGHPFMRFLWSSNKIS